MSTWNCKTRDMFWRSGCLGINRRWYLWPFTDAESVAVTAGILCIYLLPVAAN